MKTTQHNKPPETAAENRDNPEAAGSVIKALTKLVHGRKVYAANNPRLVEFQRELNDTLTAFYAGEDQLVLTIESDRILWCDHPVYKSERREDSLAFLLYKDGIGEVTIDAAAVGTEIEQLVDILTDELHNRNPADDVVTRFWNADFDHISYRVIDDYLGTETSATNENAATSETDDHAELLPSLKDKGRKIARHNDPVESIECLFREVLLENCGVLDPDEREAEFQRGVGSFFEVTEDEIEGHKRELQAEKNRDGLADFVDTVLVFTLTQDNRPAVRDISGVLTRIVEFAAAERDPQTLHQIIENIRAFHREHAVSDEIEAFMDKLESILTSPDIIRELCDRAESSVRESEKTLAYLRSVGPPAINHLLRLLHKAPAGQLRREVCDVLAVLCKDNPESLIGRLDLDNPLIAYDVVYIANQVHLGALPAKMRELPFYPDRKVKLDMIPILERIADPATTELLMRMMNDEDKAVRNRALKACGKVGDANARARITELAFAKFEQDSDEQESIFEALGLCGDADTVERLRRFAGRKGIMGLRRNRTNRLLAIHALERINLPESRKLLEEFACDSNEEVHTRAQRALEAFEK